MSKTLTEIATEKEALREQMARLCEEEDLIRSSEALAELTDTTERQVLTALRETVAAVDLDYGRGRRVVVQFGGLRVLIHAERLKRV